MREIIKEKTILHLADNIVLTFRCSTVSEVFEKQVLFKKKKPDNIVECRYNRDVWWVSRKVSTVGGEPCNLNYVRTGGSRRRHSFQGRAKRTCDWM
jgi:hypothetical protein